MECNKKRRTILSNDVAFPPNSEFNDFFRKASFENLSPEAFLHSRPYGITPPKTQNTGGFCYPTLGQPSPLEQAQSGITRFTLINYTRV